MLYAFFVVYCSIRGWDFPPTKIKSHLSLYEKYGIGGPGKTTDLPVRVVSMKMAEQ